MFSHRSMMDDRRRGTPTAFATRLEGDVVAGRRLLDGEDQNNIEVLTGKRLQQRATGAGAPPVEEAKPLVLTSLDPNTVAIGQPSFTLRVLGTGFDDSSVIIFNGNEEPTTFVSPTEVTTGVNMDVWQGASVPLPVTVEAPDGTASNALMFTFTAEARSGGAKPPVPPAKKAQRIEPD